MVSKILPLTVIGQYMFTNKHFPVKHLLVTVIKGICRDSYTVNISFKNVIVILYAYLYFYIPYIVPYMAPR